MPVVRGVLPLVELWQGVEALRLAALGDLDDGRDELLEEGELEEGGPVVVDEVDEEPLDVGAVLVLIGHDHELAVPQRLEVVHRLVLLLVGQSDDFYHLIDLLVLHDLLVGGVAHVEQLAPQRVHAVLVPEI